jgi:hypothetical protein
LFLSVKEVKNCRLAIRHFRHVKKRAKAKKALTDPSLTLEQKQQLAKELVSGVMIELG